MDWLLQYWPYLLAVLLIGLLAVRLVTMLPRFRQPTRHSGERVIRVIGVGGAGGNAINHMIRAKQRGVEYVAVNTDAQVLDESLAMRRVQIGAQLTQGLGAGGDASIGREAAVEDEAEIGRMVAGSDLVFIAAGLGGGTGSGAAPVIAAKAREAGALTVGVVTKPFTFEGAGRRKVAEEAEAELKANVDTLLLIQNEKVLDIIGEDTSMLEAFRVVNEVLARTVRAIVDVMTVPGLINLDFADIRSVMRNGGLATTGIGWASGPERAVEAAHAAVTNPLLDHDISGAGAILLNIAGASTMSMREVTRAADAIRNVADPEASIIFGTIFDDHLGDELRVTVIATRFKDLLPREIAAEPVGAAAQAPEAEAPVAEVPVAATQVGLPSASIAPEPEPEPAAIAASPLEAAPIVEAAAAVAAVSSWQEESVEPEEVVETEAAAEAPMETEATPEPEAAAVEPLAAFEAEATVEPEVAPEPEFAVEPEVTPEPEPVGFHVSPDQQEPVTPWYVGGAPVGADVPEAASTSEQPMSSSVATVLAALAEEPPAPSYQAEEQPAAMPQQDDASTPDSTYFESTAATAPAEESLEQPAPTYQAWAGTQAPADEPAPTYSEPAEALASPEGPESAAPTYWERSEAAEAPAAEEPQETPAPTYWERAEAQAHAEEPQASAAPTYQGWTEMQASAEEPQETPAPTYWERAEAEAQAEETQETPTPAPTYLERAGAQTAAYEPYAPPAASEERQDQEAPAATSYDMPEPEAATPVEESTLPEGLAEILKDESESPAEAVPEAQAPQPAQPPPAGQPPVAPRPSTPAPQRQDQVRTPTSALVGRFWSRIGKSQR